MAKAYTRQENGMAEVHILKMTGYRTIFYIWHIWRKFIDFKKAHDSVRREVLYNILIGFAIPRKLVGLIKMCLHETCSTVSIGKYQSDKFPIQNGL
jgi:hypothetical protein